MDPKSKNVTCLYSSHNINIYTYDLLIDCFFIITNEWGFYTFALSVLY